MPVINLRLDSVSSNLYLFVHLFRQLMNLIDKNKLHLLRNHAEFVLKNKQTLIGSLQIIPPQDPLPLPKSINGPPIVIRLSVFLIDPLPVYLSVYQEEGLLEHAAPGR